MKLSENYNSAKAKYGEIADKMRAAKISDGFLLSACRFNQENGVPPEDLFNYFHQWCIYVLRHKRIDVNTFDFNGFYSTIQEYKNKYGIPNQIYNDGKVVIGLLRSSKDLAYFPVKVSWCISQPKMFQQYSNDPMAYTIYIIDNGQYGKSDAERYVCMLIDKNGDVFYWNLANQRMDREAMMAYDDTLTQGALSYIGKLCQDRKGVVNEMIANRIIQITESDIKKMVMECVCRIISEATINGHTYAIKKQLGKWECIDGIYADYDFSEFGKEDYCQDVRMYMDTTAPKDVPATYCLFRRMDNGKYFYAKIVMAPERGLKKTKFLIVRRSEVPQEILTDFSTLPLPPERVLSSPSWHRKHRLSEKIKVYKKHCIDNNGEKWPDFMSDQDIQIQNGYMRQHKVTRASQLLPIALNSFPSSLGTFE